MTYMQASVLCFRVVFLLYAVTIVFGMVWLIRPMRYGGFIHRALFTIANIALVLSLVGLFFGIRGQD